MLYSKIMVPYDGSDHAKEAVRYAKELAALNPEATVDVIQALSVGAMDFQATYSDGVYYGQIDYEQYKQLLDATVAAAKKAMKDSLGDSLDELGERATVEVVPGNTLAAVLADYAKHHDIDLIVMGRRGLGAIRGMLGSVSYSLLRETDIPVLTVK